MMESSNGISNNDNIILRDDVEEQNIISLNKFIFLSIASFGLYEIWWAYKSWRFFQQKDKLDIMPAARAIFSLFFLYSLFVNIFSFAKKKGYDQNYSSGSLFAGFIILNLLSKLPDPFWLIAVFSFVFLIPPFQALNFAKQNSKEFIVNEQESFSARQIILLSLGTVFWGLVIVGLKAEE
jgi:hypothetical protein